MPASSRNEPEGPSSGRAGPFRDGRVGRRNRAARVRHNHAGQFPSRARVSGLSGEQRCIAGRQGRAEGQGSIAEIAVLIETRAGRGEQDLVAGSRGKGSNVYFWKPEAAQEFFKFNLPDTGRDMSLASDGVQFAVAHSDGNLRIFRMEKKA